MKNFIKNSLILLLLFFVFTSSAQAAQFAQTTVRFDRMKTNSPSSLQVLFVPVTTATEGIIYLSLPTGITIGASIGITNDNLPSGSTQLPGTIVATKIGQTISITGMTDLAVGTTYVFNVLSNGISTPAGAGQLVGRLTTLTGSSAAIDAGAFASYFITNDQIVITASVAPIFTFTLSGNTDVFLSQLSGSTVAATNGNTVTAGTNANKGWTGWVKSSYVALRSVGTGESIGTAGTLDNAPSTCANGTDCYVLDADLVTSGTGTGTLTIRPEYNGTGAAQGGTLSTIFQPFAGRNGKTGGDIVRLIARAAVNNTRAAGDDYTDTLTVVGAGNF